MEESELIKRIETARLQDVARQVVTSAMDEMSISRAELGRRLGVTRSSITQMFGQEGWTLNRLQEVVEAIGGTIRIEITLPAESEIKESE